LSPEALEARIEQKRKEGKLTKTAVLNDGNSAPQRRRSERRQTTGVTPFNGEEPVVREKPSEGQDDHEPLPVASVYSRYKALIEMLRSLRDDPADPAAVAELASPADLTTLEPARSFFGSFYATLKRRFPEPQPEVAS
jgi:hypothetical protein